MPAATGHAIDRWYKVYGRVDWAADTGYFVVRDRTTGFWSVEGPMMLSEIDRPLCRGIFGPFGDHQNAVTRSAYYNLAWARALALADLWKSKSAGEPVVHELSYEPTGERLETALDMFAAAMLAVDEYHLIKAPAPRYPGDTASALRLHQVVNLILRGIESDRPEVTVERVHEAIGKIAEWKKRKSN